MKPNKNTKKKQSALETNIDKSKKKVEVKNADVAGMSTDGQMEDPGLSNVKKSKKKSINKPKSKPPTDTQELTEVPKAKKRKAEAQELEDQSQDDEEHDEEVLEDEEDSDVENLDDDDDLMNDEGKELLSFDFEAFPMEEDDREGIVNMLTQIFLRSPIDTVGMADAIIKSAPFGNVIGPAVVDDEDNEEEKENVVYGLLSAVALDPRKDETPKYVSDVIEHITFKAKKYAFKPVAATIKEHLESRVGMLISERMLNFPVLVVPPIYKSFSHDLSVMKKKYKHVLYVYKIRVADEEKTSVSALVPSADGPPIKKKKLGKAEKKRLAAESRKSTDIIYDNPEDAELLKLTEGMAHHFDYPVYQDVEVGSKFHTTRKNDKTYKPYRRVVLMDAERFNAFVKKLCSLSF